MKISQKGFAPIILLIIIAVLAIGGGTTVYYVNNRRAVLQQPPVPPTNQTSDLGDKPTSTQDNKSSNASSQIHRDLTTDGETKPKVLASSSFKFPYPISWQGWNRATTSLTDATLLEGKTTSYDLVLTFKINTADGGYCSNTLKSELRYLINEEGDSIPPTSSSTDCINSDSFLPNQKVVFEVPRVVAKEYIIQINNSWTKDKTFFIVKVVNGSIKIEPAPTEG